MKQKSISIHIDSIYKGSMLINLNLVCDSNPFTYMHTVLQQSNAPYNHDIQGRAENLYYEDILGQYLL